MRKSSQADDPLAHNAQRRARMERLLFAGAALATTAVALGNVVGPKIPPFVGE
jgi:hypothetical protein